MTLVTRAPRSTLVKTFLERASRWWWAGLLVSLLGAFILPDLDVGSRDLRIFKVFADLQGFQAALDIYKQKFGDYPTEEQGLASMKGVAIKHISRDPWGSPYAYRRPTVTGAPLVYSIGQDQVDSGGAGDDIASRDEEYRCEDYGLNCGLTGEPVGPIAVLLLGVISLLVGIGRGIFGAVSRAGHGRKVG